MQEFLDSKAMTLLMCYYFQEASRAARVNRIPVMQRNERAYLEAQVKLIKNSCLWPAVQHDFDFSNNLLMF